MKSFEILIPELDDQSCAKAPTPEKAVRIRLNELSEVDFIGIEALEVIAMDESGIKSVYHVTSGRAFRCRKAG